MVDTASASHAPPVNPAKSFMAALASQLGVPYSWGNDTPATGFDCSGLVFWAAAQAGHPIGVRTSQDMYKTLPPVSKPGVGDLVLFGSGSDATHVGVCNNDGCSQMINSPNPDSVVRYDSIPGVGGFWGTEQVLGYRSIPGIGSAKKGGGESIASDISGTLSSIAGGLNPLNWGSDIEKPILEEIGKLPSQALEVFTGGHTINEIIFRTVEVLGGSVLMGFGLYLFVKVTLAKTGTTQYARAGSSAVKGGYKSSKRAASQVRTGRATRQDAALEERARLERKENAEIKKRKQGSEVNEQAPRAKRSNLPHDAQGRVILDDGSTF